MTTPCGWKKSGAADCAAIAAIAQTALQRRLMDLSPLWGEDIAYGTAYLGTLPAACGHEVGDAYSEQFAAVLATPAAQLGASPTTSPFGDKKEVG